MLHSCPAGDRQTDRQTHTLEGLWKTFLPLPLGVVSVSFPFYTLVSPEQMPGEHPALILGLLLHHYPPNLRELFQMYIKGLKVVILSWQPWHQIIYHLYTLWFPTGSAAAAAVAQLCVLAIAAEMQVLHLPWLFWDVTGHRHSFNDPGIIGRGLIVQNSLHPCGSSLASFSFSLLPVQ